MALVLAGCDHASGEFTRQTDSLYMPGKIPVGLPPVPYPRGLRLTPALVSLGRQMFFEPRLSADGRRTCAQCHDPASAFADGRQASVGRPHRPRNTPSLLNVGYRRRLGWDGAGATLEEQVHLELIHPHVMAADPSRVVATLQGVEAYRSQFLACLGGVTMQNVERALAAFLCTLLSGASPYDLFMLGRSAALDDSQRRGLELFKGKARCAACHGGPLLSDQAFHNTGAGMDRREVDPGRGEVTGRRTDRGAFGTPGLRDVAATGPYMHDGSLETLSDVVAFFNRGGSVNPNLDFLIEPLGLTRAEQSDLVAFLEALSGRRPLVGEARLPE